MDLQLTGKRALVTGGSKGIGRAIARQLSLEGADVVIAARDNDALVTVARELSAETGGRVVPIRVDTKDDASVKDLVAGMVAELGGVDILVNSAANAAGGAPSPPLADITNALFWDDVDVKVMGYIRTAREAAPHMIAAGWGRIINVAGLRARQTGSIIGSIRNIGVAALTKNLADQLGPKGINVNVVHPGLTQTERLDILLAPTARAAGISVPELIDRFLSVVTIGRIVDASEVADLVAFLASPRSVAINGDAIACGGGTKGAIHY